MADNDSSQERTEPATQQRRDDARNRGQVAQSRELVIILSLFVLILTFFFYGPSFLARAQEILRWWLTEAAHADQRTLTPAVLWKPALLHGFQLTWPFLLMGMFVTIAVHIGQIGVLFTAEPLRPDFSRLDPLQGLMRYFSLRGTIETLKSLIKLTLIGVFGYFQFLRVSRNSVQWSGLSVGQQLASGAGALGEFCVLLLILLIVFSILDLAFQKYDYERSLRMTRQEVREETKMREGDPLIRARIRSVQRERTKRRMMQQVPKADVIVTNPTHFAVALRYAADAMEAPQVVAKGADHLAARIKEIARRHDIPIVENKPLARILYRTVKVGKFIPRELYAAVAEVLAYVYKLRGKFRKSGEQPNAEA